MNIIEELRYLSKIEITPFLSRQLRLYGDAKINDVIVPLRVYALEYFTLKVMAKIPKPHNAEGIILEWNLYATAGANGTCVFIQAVREYGLSASLFSAANLLYCCTKAIEDNAVPERLQELIVGAWVGLESDAVNRSEAVITGSMKGGIIRGEQQSREKVEKDEVEIIHGRGNVSDIINRLALMIDQLGEYLSPKNELWPKLWGNLDELGLRPNEVYDNSGNPLRIDYRDGDGRSGQITFASFKVMVSTARKS